MTDEKEKPDRPLNDVLENIRGIRKIDPVQSWPDPPESIEEEEIAIIDSVDPTNPWPPPPDDPADG